MKFLGVDYGKRKIGLAISTEGKLSTPLNVIKIASIEDAVEVVTRVAKEEEIGEIVVGMSGGKMAEETKIFAEKLTNKSGVTLKFQDETLTTKDAQELSIEAGIKRKKRHQMEDAYSAALILQKYLEENKY